MSFTRQVNTLVCYSNWIRISINMLTILDLFKVRVDRNFRRVMLYYLNQTCPILFLSTLTLSDLEIRFKV